MDQARVVEVWAPGVKRFGSGYLLADCLVLTSYHLVRGLPRGARVEVRPLEVPQRTGWLAATLSWPYEAVDIEAFPERDAALLVIDELPGGAGPFVGAVRFGQVTGMDRIPCEGLGFPDAEKRPDKQRDTMPVRGHVDTLQALKSGLLTVHVDKGIVARRLRGKDGKTSSGWSGVSGAAVFCESLLVGVLATDRNIAADASVLGAAPITALADLPGFRDTLTDFDIELQLEHASPAARHLSAYLAAAHRTAIQQPYAGVVPGTTPPLTAVYLRQQISRLDTHEALVTGAGPADSVLTDPPTCVILSGPGGGKSSLLRTRLANGVKRWQDGHSEDLLPVLVHAAALAQRTLTDALTVAASDLGLVEELPKAFFRSSPRPGARWLVLLDGLDEVADPAQRNKILHKLAVATTGEHAHLYRFVIATRPLPGGELDILGTGVPRYDLQPFDHDDLETVARGWFQAAPLPDPAAAARRFVQTLDRSRLSELARVPLMTAMLCQLHAAAPDQPVPASRGQIYRDFTTLLGKRQPLTDAPNARYPGLEGYASDAFAPAQKVLEHLQDLIDCLAAERHAGNTLPALTIVQSRHVARCPKNILATDWRAFLDACLRRSGLLTPQGDDLDFLHQTLLEHLAARHLTDATHSLMDDPHTGTRALHDVFYQPRRYWPRRQQCPDGITPRVWGRRYWAPPDPDLSYVGFLLDAANRRGRAAGAQYLGRLTRGGLPGWECIAALHRLGTDLPDKVLRTTADGLYALARDTTQTGYIRVGSAEALAGLGDPRGADLLYALAHGATMASHERVRTNERVRAAKVLADQGDPQAAGLLYVLVHDTTLNGGDRVWAAEALANRRDPRASDLLNALAHDTTQAGYARVRAAEVLAGLGDSCAADLLYTLAQVGLVRLEAAKALAGLGDPRGADLMHAIAGDTTQGPYDRMPAAEALANRRDPRAVGLLCTLACDTTLNGRDRLGAVGLLAKHGDPRVVDLLHVLAQDTTLNSRDRLSAARPLADRGDSRAVDLLHAFAHDTTLNSGDRGRAARLLAEYGDPRGVDLLHALVHNTTLNGDDRLLAAEALARRGDLRASDLLHALICDTVLSPYEKVRAAVALAGLGDPRGADHLHSLAHKITLAIFDREDARYGVWAAKALADRGDPRAADLLHALARSTFLDSSQRVGVAEELAGLGDPRGVDLLHTLARDTMLSSYERVRAAEALADHGDPHGAHHLRALARDTMLSSYERVRAAEALAGLGVTRVADLYSSRADRFLKIFRRGRRPLLSLQRLLQRSLGHQAEVPHSPAPPRLHDHPS